MSDIYKIAVQLAFQSNASAALGAIAGHLTGLEGKMKSLEKKFGSLTRAKVAFFGAAGIVAGSGIFMGLAKVAGYGEELLDQQNQLKRLGQDQNQTLKMTADYYAKIAKQIPTSTASEYLKTVRELRAVTGDWQKAQDLAPRAMKFDALLANINGGKGSGGASYSEFYKVLRSAEMKGISTNPAKLGEYTDDVFSLIEAFGGKLDANAFQLLAKRGGTSFARTDLKKALGAIAVMSADLGGDTAGTALMTLQQFQDGAGVLSKQQYKTLKDAGLINSKKVQEQGFGRVQMSPGALLGSMDYDGDLPGWIEKVVAPHVMDLARREAAKDGTPDKWRTYFDADMAKIMRNRNAGRAAMMFSDPGFIDQRMKDLGLAKEAMDVDKAYDTYTKDDPKGVKQAFNSQFHSMMEAIGAPLMQAAIPVMKGITDVFTKMGELANQHPEVIKALGIGLAALGAALITAGGVALAAAVGAGGWFALFAGALAAAGMAIATWGDKITSFFNSIGSWIAGLVPKVPQLPASPGGANNGPMELLPQSYTGGGMSGGQLLKTALESDGSSGSGGAKLVAGAINGGISNSNVVILGGGGGGFGGGGFGGGGFGGGGHWNGSMMPIGGGVGHAASADTRAAFIRAYAARIGIDPNTALRVAQSEGFYTYTGDHGMSFGDFQLYTGGGIGNRALAAGIDIRDPRNWMRADAFALDEAKRGGWGPWHGAARVGIYGYQGIGRAPVPTAKKPDINVHTAVHMDGKQVAKVVAKRIAVEMRHPNGIGRFDDRLSRIEAGATTFAA